MRVPEADDALVKDLCEIEDGLTDWEVSFAESLARQVIDARRPLTERQRAKAEDILKRLEK